MKNVIHDYAWGSVDAIPALLGYDNKEGKPQAELWMGSHRRGASVIAADSGELSLADYIAEEKDEILGASLADRYGDLPFLFKVLAAGSPLSIQVHPDKAQAEEGFAYENSISVPLDAFNRNYKDDNHKPEIICALTEFWAMRGFRPIEKIIAIFKDLALPVFSREIEAFSVDATSTGLETFFSSIMALEGDRKKTFIKQLIEAVSSKEDDKYEWVSKLHDKYPDDAAIAAPLYLNLVKLKPGQALYLAAGELHAYLEGLGMELMASSDNVLRGGLTPKYIDREELKKIVNFSGADPEILEARSASGTVEVYNTPSEEFELSRIKLAKGDSYNTGDKGEVQILFVAEGDILCSSSDGETIKALKGESVFVPRSANWDVEGDAVLFRASVPGDRT